MEQEATQATEGTQTPSSGSESPQGTTAEGAAASGGLLSKIASEGPQKGKGGKAAAPAAPEPPKWHWADGVPGEGDPPEWLKADKYKSVEDQAKAFLGLEKKLGAVPEEYVINVPKDLTEAGYEFDTSVPLVQDFLKLAREARMPQAAVDKMIDLYTRDQITQRQEDLTQTLKDLGEPGRRVAGQVYQWATANLDADQQKWLDSTLRTAEDIYSFHAILQRLSRGGTKEPTVPGGGGGSSERERLKAEIDVAMADPRYKSDPAFEANVRGMFSRLVELEQQGS
jgi:hypothetical protein